MNLPASSFTTQTTTRWPFQIKICGITHLADAIMAEAAGADALGFNFYPRSMRCTTASQVAEIKAQLDNQRIQSVGVFVNQDAQWINDIAQQLNLAAIQLHGDESPEVMTHFRDRTVIRCLRPSPQVSLETCLAQCQLWIDAGVQSILIDAPPPQRRGELELAEGETPDPYGGTGLTSNWQLAAQLREHLPVPLILAGGLNPSNVAEAINTVHPAAVDVASGVESFPGKKNSQQLESFISRAKQAFAIEH